MPYTFAVIQWLPEGSDVVVIARVTSGEIPTRSFIRSICNVTYEKVIEHGEWTESIEVKRDVHHVLFGPLSITGAQVRNPDRSIPTAYKFKGVIKDVPQQYADLEGWLLSDEEHTFSPL